MPHLAATPLDSDLLRQARAGDRRAHEVIYRQFFAPVYGLIRRLVGRTAVAEEITQDVFVEILRSIDGYAGQGAFGAWVRRIAVSKSLMYLRSPWHRAGLWLDPDDDGDTMGPAEQSLVESTSESLLSGREEAALEQALSRLAPLTRSVVWLHDVEGYTHAEIALELNRTVSFSKSQLARAHERLRQSLAAQEEVVCTPASSSC